MQTAELWEFQRATWILAEKDLRAELRRSSEILSIIAFSVGSVLIAGLGASVPEHPEVVAALLWIILFFVNVLIFTTAFTREVDRGTLGGLKTLPCSPLAILFGKVIYGSVLVCIVGAIVIPSAVLFFHLDLGGRFPAFFLVYFLGSAGLTCAGSFVSGLVMFSEGKTILLSFLLIPICMPVVIPSVVATTTIILGGSIADILPELKLITAFLLVLLSIMILAFGIVFRE